MIRIFHAPYTRSVRVIWLAEEMGLPYEVQTCTLRDPPPELISHNPGATLPLLIDGDKVLAESVVMLDYLAETYGPTPLALHQDDDRYWDYRQMLMFGEATLTAPINAIVGTVFTGPPEQQGNFTVGVIRDLLRKRLAVVQMRLKNHPYMLGDDFTLADISVGYAVNLMANIKQLGLQDLITPDVAAYHDRLAARPAFQRTIKVK
jgi:glutathione S-transferase